MSNISVKSGLTPAKFDFSKYQTADLVRHLTELASFPGALRTTLLMAVRCAASFVSLVYLQLKSWYVSSIRFYAMLPLYIAFLVAMAGAFLPLEIMWWFAN